MQKYFLITIKKINYGKENDEKALAHGIFHLLRQVDGYGAKAVYIHAPPKTGVGLAVYNRLIRAAGFKVIVLKNMVGMTGPTGSGKSSAGVIAREMGIKVIDCDEYARIAVRPGMPGLDALVNAFGIEILNQEDGTLNREALAAVAFSSKEKTELLNKTLLPHIVTLIYAEIDSSQPILLDAPTLFESGMDLVCDKTLTVLADKEIRLKRIIERDKLTITGAKERMNAGKDDDFYRNRADYIVCNNSDEDTFYSEISAIFKNAFGGL